MNDKLNLEVGKSYVDFGNTVVNMIHKKKNGTFIGLTAKSEHVWIYSEDGKSLESQFSLRKEYIAPVIVKADFWMNIYDNRSYTYVTKELADTAASPERLECLHFQKEYEVKSD